MKSPSDKVIKMCDLFLPLKPDRHLGEFIFAIGCGICIFCQIDMKVLGVFCVVVVSCSKESNR